MSGLILIQFICEGYQQTTLAGRGICQVDNGPECNVKDTIDAATLQQLPTFQSKIEP